MRIIGLIWLIVAAVLLIIGWALAIMNDKESKKARTGYTLAIVGNLMSAMYFFGILIF